MRISDWSSDVCSSDLANPDPYALWPRLSPSSHPNNTPRNTWFMRNGSFMRLKNAEIGYTLPQRTMDRLKINKQRFYVSGTNLLFWSKFTIWDVEMVGDGLGYPVQSVTNIVAPISF